MRITLAVLHLIALGIGFGAIFVRARAANALRAGHAPLKTVLRADSAWGIAFLLWLATGLWRWLGSVEKSASYYTTNHVFLAKMGLLVAILLLEIWPMVTLIRWRVHSARHTIDVNELGPKGRRIARISDVQLLLLTGMIVAATMMARGYGAR